MNTVTLYRLAGVIVTIVCAVAEAPLAVSVAALAGLALSEAEGGIRSRLSLSLFYGVLAVGLWLGGTAAQSENALSGCEGSCGTTGGCGSASCGGPGGCKCSSKGSKSGDAEPVKAQRGNYTAPLPPVYQPVQRPQSAHKAGAGLLERMPRAVEPAAAGNGNGNGSMGPAVPTLPKIQVPIQPGSAKTKVSATKP
jgi:hypothetical protein